MSVLQKLTYMSRFIQGVVQGSHRRHQARAQGWTRHSCCVQGSRQAEAIFQGDQNDWLAGDEVICRIHWYHTDWTSARVRILPANTLEISNSVKSQFPNFRDHQTEYLCV
jgi:hypothetical protein